MPNVPFFGFRWHTTIIAAPTVVTFKAISHTSNSGEIPFHHNPIVAAFSLSCVLSPSLLRLSRSSLHLRVALVCHMVSSPNTIDSWKDGCNSHVLHYMTPMSTPITIVLRFVIFENDCNNDMPA